MWLFMANETLAQGVILTLRQRFWVHGSAIIAPKNTPSLLKEPGMKINHRSKK